MSRIRLRPARTGDQARLIALQRDTIGSSYRPFLGDAVVDGFIGSGAVEAYVETTIERCRVLVLDGQIVGCAVLEADLLDLMMIEPPRQRQGLGSRLLAEVERDLFAQHPEIRLESFALNNQANVFYRKHNWTEVERFADRDLGSTSCCSRSAAKRAAASVDGAIAAFQHGAMAAYSDAVMEHFEHPRNAGTMDAPDGEATVSNPVCGDRMQVMLRVVDGRIEKMQWLTRGCPPAIATSSFTSELVEGWTLAEAESLTRHAIAEGIGGLPKDKVHCSVLAADAIRKAIADHRQRSA